MPTFSLAPLHCPAAREDTSSFLIPHLSSSSLLRSTLQNRQCRLSLPRDWKCRALSRVHTNPLGPASFPEAEGSWEDWAAGDQAGCEVFHASFPIGLFSNLQLIICFLFLPVLKSVFFLYFLSDQFLKNQLKVSLVTAALPLFFNSFLPGLAAL